MTGLAALLHHQSGVATLEQLADCGVTASRVRAHVTARRWQRLGDRCVLTHNHVPSRHQCMWLALLDYRVPVALAGATALEVAGFRYFGDLMEQVHVVIPRGCAYHRFPGVKVHESRRFGPEDIVTTRGFPSTPLARSALDAAAWQPFQRYAAGLLAAVVQQRVCTADELAAELRFVGRVRHKRVMRLTLHDVAGGAEALSELDLTALCRAFGLREPDRQVVRRDPGGRRRYLDCEWTLPDGSVVVLEVDGAHHMDARHWESDMRRDRHEVVRGRRVLRCTAYEARHEPDVVAADLIAVGVPTELSEARGARARRRSDKSAQVTSRRTESSSPRPPSRSA